VKRLSHSATLLIFALASATAHAGLLAGLSGLERPKPKAQRPLEMAVLVKAPELPPPQRPRQRPKRIPVVTAAPARDTAPPPPPTFGVSLSSTVGSGAFAVALGNTVLKEPESIAEPEPRPYVAPISAVSKLPKKVGECVAAYPQAARAEGREGQVVLDVDIDAQGKVGVVRVVEGLDAELDHAAREALRRCVFTPAEVGGAPVATRIRYTYTFVIEG
jgi:periplasmic protein TonB